MCEIFKIDAQPLGLAYFGQGPGDILLDEIMCTGNESTLQDCGSQSSHDCTHSEDAGVRCQSERVGKFCVLFLIIVAK